MSPVLLHITVGVPDDDTNYRGNMPYLDTSPMARIPT